MWRLLGPMKLLKNGTVISVNINSVTSTCCVPPFFTTKQNKLDSKIFSLHSFMLYVPVTVHREQSLKKEYQQDATI